MKCRSAATRRCITSVFFLSIFASAFAILGGTSALHAASGDTTADNVFGQLSFDHNFPNLLDGKGFYAPFAVAVDHSSTPNHVYVADTANNRVLGWNDAASFTNGQSADLVIGQPDMLSGACNGSVQFPGATTLCGPAGLGVDSNGNLYVADAGNSRVLEYANPFAAFADNNQTGGFTANLVFGQGGSFSSTGCNNGGERADSLCLGTNESSSSFSEIAIDSNGNVYIADQPNNRVLEYDNPLASGGGNPGTPGSAGDTTADRVFGQCGQVFTGSNCPNTISAGAISADSLGEPQGVAVDGSGNVWIADTDTDRVLWYDDPTATSGGNPGTPGSPGDETAIAATRGSFRA